MMQSCVLREPHTQDVMSTGKKRRIVYVIFALSH